MDSSAPHMGYRHHCWLRESCMHATLRVQVWPRTSRDPLEAGIVSDFERSNGLCLRRRSRRRRSFTHTFVVKSVLAAAFLDEPEYSDRL